MAMTATYKDSTKTIKNAYIRIGRIWGSSRENWNAWVEVYEKEGDLNTIVPVFHVSAPYVDGQSPFGALYDAIERLSFIVTESESPKLIDAVAEVVKTSEAPKAKEKKAKINKQEKTIKGT